MSYYEDRDEPDTLFCLLCRRWGVYRVSHRGRRTAAEGQVEPDESWLSCSHCGVVEEADVSDQEPDEET